MPKHMSNSERISRAAAEADAKSKAREEKAKAKAAAPPRVRKPRAPPAPKRIKIVWSVGKPGVAPVGTFPYNQREAADAEAARIGGGCAVTPVKVPMEA